MKQKARSFPAGPAGVNAGPAFLNDSLVIPPDRSVALRPIGTAAATAYGGACAGGGVSVTSGEGLGQQLQAHGGQVSPGAQAGQAQAQAPPPRLLPASTVDAGEVRAQTPVGHGVVRHSMLSEVQPHASVVSAVHEVASV